MTNKKNSLSIKRIIQLLGICFGILIAVVVALNVYVHLLFVEAVEQAIAQDGPRPIVDTYDLAPKAALNLLIEKSGINGNDPTYTSTSTLTKFNPIINAARLFVKTNGVVASERKIENRSWSWSVIDGYEAPYQIETIDWCVRLRYEFGQEKSFAYILWRLARLPSGDSVGLEPTIREMNLTPNTAINYIDPESKNGLRLPIQTTEYGASDTDGASTVWRILPNPAICAD